METRTLHEDINIIYIQADSFPDGIDAVWQKIFTILPDVDKRITYVGYSAMQTDGSITYRVGTPLLASDDASKFTTMVIPKGVYISRRIENYMDHRDEFGNIFQELLAMDKADKTGCCIEWYESETVAHCMVPSIS